MLRFIWLQLNYWREKAQKEFQKWINEAVFYITIRKLLEKQWSKRRVELFTRFVVKLVLALNGQLTSWALLPFKSIEKKVLLVKSGREI